MSTSAEPGRLYLGLDSSTQSLSAVVIEVTPGDDAGGVVFETAIAFDDALPHYGTTHGVLPNPDPAVAVSSPVMWAEALDVLLPRLAAEIDLSRLVAISGSAQQHGSVYLNAAARTGLESLDPARPLADQLGPLLARPVAPIWMDSSTTRQCRTIAAAVGGDDVLAHHTGSRAFERFTAAQIRKFAEEDAGAYQTTDRIHLVSSFVASLLVGRHAPLDRGDASGMNLMDLATGDWWPPAVAATAPELSTKLPAIVPSTTVVGTLSRYWQQRHGLPAAAVVAWSGDNPCSLIGVGLAREGQVAVSLGTSDTIFGIMDAPRVSADGTGHVFGAPTGAFMGLTCFSNGSLARERIRDRYSLTWETFSDVLASMPPGHTAGVLLPWFDPEITPHVTEPGERRYALPADDAAANVRGVIEGQLTAMARHAAWMGVSVDRIHATGGGAANAEILQVMADVFGAPVFRLAVSNSAALGAALRAWQAERAAEEHPVSWEVVAKTVSDAGSANWQPNPAHRSFYAALAHAQAACEAHALGRGPDPEPELTALARL